MQQSHGLFAIAKLLVILLWRLILMSCIVRLYIGWLLSAVEYSVNLSISLHEVKSYVVVLCNTYSWFFAAD